MTSPEARPGAHVIVCVGPGGVGKTTTAAALALRGARAGLRACVVTIDPARRLADALGIGEVGNEPHRVEAPPGSQMSGELWAVMLDAQTTFDDLVSRYATGPDQAATILANPVYRNISAALSGTQEYMAVEKLYELQESGAFDLIVVDTPPAQHALDFLEAPKHLTRLLDNRVFRLLMTPTRAGLRALEIGEQLMLRTIAKVAGGQVVADTIGFFTQFEGMEEGFRARARRAEEVLHSDLTSFVLVCLPRRDTVDEALYLVTDGGVRGRGDNRRSQPVLPELRSVAERHGRCPCGHSAELAGRQPGAAQLGRIDAGQPTREGRLRSAQGDRVTGPVPIARRCRRRVAGGGRRLPRLGRPSPEPLTAWAS